MEPCRPEGRPGIEPRIHDTENKKLASVPDCSPVANRSLISAFPSERASTSMCFDRHTSTYLPRRKKKKHLLINMIGYHSQHCVSWMYSVVILKSCQNRSFVVIYYISRKKEKSKDSNAFRLPTNLIVANFSHSLLNLWWHHIKLHVYGRNFFKPTGCSGGEVLKGILNLEKMTMIIVKLLC